MGRKHKHAQDKLYKTVSELKSHHVAENRDYELSTLHRRIKFDTCCLTLNTVSKNPVGLCDDDGYCYVFDCDAIGEFLEKFKIHPVTGSKVSADKLIELKFHKNEEGQYHCPVIYKLFNQHSKIVVNRKSGHVISYEAYNKLNLRENNLRDLLTDEPFEVGDVAILQDPDLAVIKWKVSEFHHIKNKLSTNLDDAESKIRNVNQSDILKTVLKECESESTEIEQEFNRKIGQDTTKCGDKVKLDKINSANYSDGALSKSVTSTIQPAAVSQTPALLDIDQVLYPRIKKKGYAQILTNMGPINLELFCDRCPKTCHNFLLLASRGYYDGTVFHRLIKNFMIQGGDPTGTGSGGESAWKVPFRDECHGDLKHEGRGVLAMANSGIHSNKSQFYITLKGKWEHLDGKHTIFGRLVGGEETLDRIETIETDKKDRPKKDITILNVNIYSNPFEDAEKAIEVERAIELQKNRTTTKSTLKRNDAQTVKKFRSGVCAYIDLDRLHQQIKSDNPKYEPTLAISENQQDLPGHNLSTKLSSLNNQIKSNRTYGDFSNW